MRSNVSPALNAREDRPEGKPRIAVLNSTLGIVHRGGDRAILEISQYLESAFHIVRFSGGQVRGISSRQVPTLVRTHPAARILEGMIPSPWKHLIRRLYLMPVDIERLTFNTRVAPHLLQGRFDLILTPGDFWATTVCRMVRTVRETPFITISQGLAQSSREALRSRPDAHAVVNPHVEARLSLEFPDRCIRFIPNGVDLDQFTPGPFHSPFQLERPVFLCVSACEPRKRIDLAIRAVAKLKRGSLLLLGDGELRTEQVRLGTSLLGTGRFLQTTVPLSEMAQYYRACDVFTLPSQNEPFGLVYLEAMACNRPVVATRDPIREYIVGDAGLLCDCEDLGGYARALAEVAQHDFGRTPRRQAERFSWSIIGPRYVDLIQEVLARRRSRPTKKTA